jgi:hypothetical protein
VGFPGSCLAVKALGASTDGTYSIYVHFRYFDVYCADMSTGAPKEYITLQKTGTFPATAPFGSPLAAPGNPAGATVSGGGYTVQFPGMANFSSLEANGPYWTLVTMFSKVRLLLATMEIDTTDTRFTTTKRYDPNSALAAMPYANAEGCSGFGSAVSSFGNVDLTGTPFQVNDSFTLAALFQNGYANATGTWTPGQFGPFAVTGQVVNFGVSGTCGNINPQSPTRLKLAFAS